MSEYEITGCLRAQRELRRTETARHHGNTAPQGRSLSMVLKASRPQEGRKQRGRDAGAVRAADKESQLYPHGLMLLIL